MLASHARFLVKCLIFLVLIAAFIAIEHKLRGGPNGGPSFVRFAALLTASLFCSALLSYIVTEAFDDVWEKLEDPQEEVDSPGKRSADNLLLDDEPIWEEEFSLEDAPVPMTPFLDP